MSGGSYDYAYMKVSDMADNLAGQTDADGHKVRDLTPEQAEARRKFATLLRKVATAMHDIEWVDSGDSRPGDEIPAIQKALGLRDS